MKPSSEFARFTAMCLCLLAVCALTACKPNSIKPDSAPMPPRVACEAGPAAQIPPIPPLWEMDQWAAVMMAIFEAEVTKRAAEHACLAKLRAAGVIR